MNRYIKFYYFEKVYYITDWYGEKTIASIVLIIFATYVVMNMSFFNMDTQVLMETANENFENQQKLLLDVDAREYNPEKDGLKFGNIGEWSSKPHKDGNYIKIQNEKLTGKELKNEQIQNITDFSIMIKCFSNNNHNGIDGVLNTTNTDNIDSSSLTLYRGENPILDIHIPNKWGKIGILDKSNTRNNATGNNALNDTSVKQWQYMEGDVLPISEIVHYTFNHKMENGKWKLEVYYNKLRLGIIELDKQIELETGENERFKFVLNNGRKLNINFFFLKIFKHSLSKKEIGNIIDTSTVNGKHGYVNPIKSQYDIDDDDNNDEFRKEYFNNGGEEEREEKKMIRELIRKLQKLYFDRNKYECLLQMRIKEDKMNSQQVLETKMKCVNKYTYLCQIMKLSKKLKKLEKTATIPQLHKRIKALQKEVNIKKTKYENEPPTAFLSRRGEYMVYIYIDSIISRETGNNWGIRSYGKNRRRARDMFIANFPRVIVPIIFDDNYKSCVKRNRWCPFVMKNRNPCGRNGECSNVNWKKTQFNQLPPKCKSNVNNYCSVNSTYDPICICWNPKYANTDKCRAHRAQFADKTINSCSVDIFNIEDHPNFKNYVSKDNIPCYGCVL